MEGRHFLYFQRPYKRWAITTASDDWPLIKRGELRGMAFENGSQAAADPALLAGWRPWQEWTEGHWHGRRIQVACMNRATVPDVLHSAAVQTPGAKEDHLKQVIRRAEKQERVIAAIANHRPPEGSSTCIKRVGKRERKKARKGYAPD